MGDVGGEFKASSLMIAKFGQENSKLIFYFFICISIVCSFVCFCFCFLKQRLRRCPIYKKIHKSKFLSVLWRILSNNLHRENALR